MKKILIALLLMIFPLTAYAYEITSPFGWRTHPIYGDERYHTGVDIGADLGDAIPATDSGVVNFAGIDGSLSAGYGRMVCITHDDGTETRYAHLNEILVVNGQRIDKGEFIGTAGSSGGSTGPHLHLEYRVNGVATDPVPYLINAGWDVSYNIGGGSSLWDLLMSEMYDEVPWDFDAFYNMGNQVQEILELFISKISEAVKLLKDNILWLLVALMTIDLATFMILNGFQFDFTIFNRLMKYCFITFLVLNWQEFVNDVVLNFFTTSAETFSADSAGIIESNVSNPATIMQKGVFLIQPAFAYISDYTGLKLIMNLVQVLIALFLALGTLFCFFLIGIQIGFIYLEFYIMAVLCIVTLPFGVTSQMKYLAEKGIGALISSGIKLMVISFIVAILVSFLRDIQPAAYEHIEYIKVFFTSIAMVVLCLRIPKAASRLLGGGTPKL